ncbi:MULTISPECIES: TetR/AcrR family transcriptional regulator [Parafrankia]|uniref:TetR family transcriptional regulator n=1 Tax=Parafrankia soli TaxID=2599596 RepID=A0A1S1RCS1_9ACTN|nr:MULTISPECIES: TetR/AcrR family transcriptional regulator [Parafrankia]OHV43980.1 TetR family transcriptional regulator [Parafrankia soli]TCJ32564.1 TetR/AcrR family transcriptional regulator [Parafrankia sp. BMG5.11]CAI7980913.1 TetR family transcriptional regulator [Frankia sp. Hr75.2]
MVSQRQAGSATSSTRDQLLDAAEQLMLEEGYAAVTSRRVGARAGLTPQLVHYYFRTMDDLFLEVFRRRADVGLELFRAALQSRPTLRQLWDLRDTGMTTPRFNLEFMALANHRKAIRVVLTEYYRSYREVQLAAFTAALADLGVPPERCPPLVARLVMIGITQIMAIDAELGVESDGEVVDDFIRRQIEDLVEQGPERTDSDT